MKRFATSFVLLLTLSIVARAADAPVQGKNGMVVCVSAPAADVGLDILKKGGNAVDAAVAVAFAQAVTYPAAGNIGGGGFMNVYPGGGKDPVVFEYRETAPKAASKTMYSKDDSAYGYKVVGVPGTVRGMALAHQRFGKLAWKDVVMPAVRLADEGFLLDSRLASSLNSLVATSPEFPELQRVFGKQGAADWQAGDRLIQRDLAWSLLQIAENGADAFYKGPIADKLVAEMK